MSRKYMILNNGRVLYAPGHYDLEDANKIAENAAKRSPGRTFKVVEIRSTYQVKKAKKRK